MLSNEIMELCNISNIKKYQLKEKKIEAIFDESAMEFG